MTTDRRHILVGVRVNAREHARWIRAAALEDLRLPELVREAVRAHLRELERLRLLRHGTESATGPPRPAA